jgi:hypothetical protein
MEEGFEPTDFGGPVETIEGVEADDDAEMTGGQSGFIIIIIRSFPECLRRGLPISFDGAGWICGINALMHSAGRGRHSGQDLEVADQLKQLSELKLMTIRRLRVGNLLFPSFEGDWLITRVVNHHFQTEPLM